MNLNDADLRDALVLLLRVRALGERIRERMIYSEELATTAGELRTAADEVLRVSVRHGPATSTAAGTGIADRRHGVPARERQRA